jgi:hypothetical protein
MITHCCVRHHTARNCSYRLVFKHVCLPDYLFIYVIIIVLAKLIGYLPQGNIYYKM